MSGDHGDRVVVIGAGIAGLVTAKVLRNDGFDVLVFEKEHEIGGVWAPSRTYPGLRANNSRDTYAFSDHPYDRSADLFPTAEQVRAYLQSYVARFGLAPLIRQSTEVVSVERREGGFEVMVRGAEGTYVVACDFVAVCAGPFSDPYVPKVEGADQFTGTLVHSSQANDPGLFAGKRVIVVGAGKSALDCAAWAGQHAQSCTLVFRAPQWMLPRFLPGGIPVDRLLFQRLVEMSFRYHRLNGFERFLHGPARSLVRLLWRINSRVLRLLLRMPTEMVPDDPLPLQIETAGVASEFFELAHRGEVGMRRDEIAAFTGGDGISLAGGDTIAADVVIFATGWQQSLQFLTPELRSAARCNGYLTLYRHILPPSEPQLGFVGYASSTACQLTSEISAHWLSQHLRGELRLPGVEDMYAEIKRVSAWQAEVFPAHPQGHFIGPYLVHHIDDLIADMGLPPRRAGNVASEYLALYTPERYSNLAAQRAAQRVREQRPRHIRGLGHHHASAPRID